MPRPTWPETAARRTILTGLAFGLLVVACYFPALRAGFVWDDVIITTLTAIHDWNGIWGLWFAPGSAYRQGPVGEYHYWPLLYTTFWLEHKVWGLAPAGYHAVNLGIHFINTVLLWRLLLRLDVPGPWWIAALFAVHPLQVEPVAWVIARKDLLSALFYLAAFTTWLRFTETRGPGRYILALTLFAAGMLCKSMVVTFPAALLIHLWWKQERVNAKDLLRVLPFFLVGLALAGIDLAIYQKVNLSFDYSMTERLLIAAHSLWFYVGKLLWPIPLALLYPHWDLADPLGWGYVAATACAFALLWFLRRRIGRGPLACALFFAVTLSPVLGFVDFGYMKISFVADRYQYLAGIGVLTLAVGVVAHGAQRLPDSSRRILGGGAWVVLALLGVATWNQSEIYRDDVTLFGHSVAVNPGSWAAHHYFGAELFKRGRYEEAERHMRRSLELPRPAGNGRHRRNTLQKIAEAQRRRGRYNDAVSSYRAVLETDARYGPAHAGMGDALFRLGRYEEAAAALERALALLSGRQAAETLQPLFVATLDRLAHSRFMEKRYREALALYRKILEVRPDDARTHSNVGAALFNLGRLSAAERSFERALSLKPDLELARAGLRAVRKRLQRGKP